MTLATVLKGIGQEDLPVEKTWRLNERHYGGHTGLNKAETAAKHGEEQVRKTEMISGTFNNDSPLAGQDLETQLRCSSSSYGS